MRKSSKVISMLLAVVMVVSCFTAFAVINAAAADDTKIYFEFPTSGIWGDASKATPKNCYAHIWAIYGNETELESTEFGDKPERLKKTDTDGLFYFDTATLGTIEENADYGIIFHTTADGKYQSCNVTFSADCLGDTLYITGNKIENPIDSQKLAYEAAWKKNSDKYGPMKVITSTGKALGQYFPAHQPKAQLISNALHDYLLIPANEVCFTTEKNLALCEEVGTNALDVYNQYISDNAVALGNGIESDKDMIKKGEETPYMVVKQVTGTDASGKEVVIPAPSYVQERLGLSDEDINPSTEPPEEPTTVEPTTVEPTTVEPTTAEPTTAEPTTLEPTTAEPTTLEPTTAEPTTVEPTTVEPTTVEPTTVEPTTVAPAPEAKFVVTGSAALMGEDYAWNPAISFAEMTADGDVYTYTFENVAAGDMFQLKVVEYPTPESPAEWHGDHGTDANVEFAVTAPCAVTVTYDPATQEITVTGENVTDPVIPIDVVRAAGSAVKDSPNYLHGISWDPTAEVNTLEEIADGIYSISFTDLVEGEFQLKFTANGGWDVNWGGAAGERQVTETGYYFENDCTYNGDNLALNCEDDDDEVTFKFDLTVTLDLRNYNSATKEGAKFTATFTKVEEPEPGENYIIGDVNRDGKVDVVDGTMIQAYSIGLRNDFDDYQVMIADTNGDGVVNILDVTAIQYYAVGRFDRSFYAGKVMDVR